MVLRRIGAPLELEERPLPEPGPGEVRIKVEACAICRTDLHVIDGDLPNVRLPLVPGHEIVGQVEGGWSFNIGHPSGTACGCAVTRPYVWTL